MRLTFIGMVRLVVFLALGLCALAVGLGRMLPPHSRIWRSLERSRYVATNSRVYRDDAGSTPLLNLETGYLVRLPVPDGGSLHHATPSPWLDENGQTQVAGAWAKRTGRGLGSVTEEFGLARLTFPEGELLDTYPTDVLPSGPLCWFPGIEARVLFTTGNGGLYVFDFDRAGRHDVPREWSKPLPVRWQEGVKPAPSVFLSDPAWPKDSAWGGDLVASLSPLKGTGRTAQRGTPKLWWLRFSHDGLSIKAAGRLTSSNGPGGTEEEERYPVPGRTRDGSPVVAYLARAPHEPGWKLRVAPLVFSSGTGEKQIDRESERTLAEDCAPWAPAFALDWSWVACVPRLSGNSTRVIHCPLGPSPSVSRRADRPYPSSRTNASLKAKGAPRA